MLSGKENFPTAEGEERRGTEKREER